MLDTPEAKAIRKSCQRFLINAYPKNPHQVLSELVQTIDPALEADHYGQGEVVASFENEIATLLGKEAAIFMPTGTMCQQIALRAWSQRRGTSNVAFHPTCHLELHEEKAYERLHGLHAILLGPAQRLFTLADLQAVTEPLAALLIELPQRELGGQLPSWDELNAIISWAHDHTIATHLDGARLWECQPFYQREYAEIAQLFDTVYVSFYKILGAIAGSVLAGPADVIAEARTWRHRQGGNLFHFYPYVLSAQKGLREHLGHMQRYYTKAREIAALLSPLPEITILPDPPQTNMMHLYLHGKQDRLQAAALEIAKETGIWSFSWLASTQLPDISRLELTVGEATLDISNQEIQSLFQQLVARANA